jgi:hypothetical protein
MNVSNRIAPRPPPLRSHRACDSEGRMIERRFKELPNESKICHRT